MFNFNIGVLGHVDSGKTSLSRCLSTIASTAAFDKNPQSQERGITLDLGFSSFEIAAPTHLQSAASSVQVTLVDCPGHASLIRTIIAGAQIIDAMILVVDVTKGIQTQTAECLVIGEILCSHLLVILNKVDLLPPDKSKTIIEKMIKRIRLTLQTTKFTDVKVIPVAVKPGGGVDPASTVEPLGIPELLAAVQQMIYVPSRQTQGPVVFAVDHCFGIRGQGTVMTGTVLQGRVAVNDSLEIPSLAITKKVKSMQMFHKPVDKASQGDRAGICVTQFDPKLLERGLACTPGIIKVAFGILVLVEKIAYYKHSVETKAKFHISVGNETVMAKVSFFGIEAQKREEFSSKEGEESCFDYSREYHYQGELLGREDDSGGYVPSQQYALLQLERSVPVLPGSLLIGSKLDMDVHTNMCRLAFKGRTLEMFVNRDYTETQLPAIKVFKSKSKVGVVERMVSDSEVIVKGLLKRDTNLQLFVGLQVRLSTGEEGEIDGHFGTSGKIKVRISKDGLLGATKERLKALTAGKKKGKNASSVTGSMQGMSLDNNAEQVTVKLDFKKYVFAVDKKMVQ